MLWIPKDGARPLKPVGDDWYHHASVFVSKLLVLKELPYILESHPHPFYSFRGLKNQMRIRFAVESWILEK